MHYSELGYNSYDGNGGYLAGKEWQQLHDFFYQYCGSYRCRICGQHRNLVLHKRTYEVLTMWALRKKCFFIKPLMIYWLKKHFVWLCRTHNSEIHFYDNKTRVPLTYEALWKREQQVYRRYHSILRLILKMRPSDIFRYIGRWLATTYSV